MHKIFDETFSKKAHGSPLVSQEKDLWEQGSKQAKYQENSQETRMAFLLHISTSLVGSQRELFSVNECPIHFFVEH